MDVADRCVDLFALRTARTRLTLATPGIGDAMNQPQFDPERVSPCQSVGTAYTGVEIRSTQGWLLAITAPIATHIEGYEDESW